MDQRNGIDGRNRWIDDKWMNERLEKTVVWPGREEED